MASVLAVAILVWFLPGYLLHRQGEDWKAWFIVGPFATLVIVVMITVTYGLAAGSRGERNEQAVRNRPEQHIEEVLQDQSGFSATMSVQARQQLDLAYELEDRGEFTDALRKCETAVRFDPGYAEAHNLRGIVLEELERTAEAIAAYGEAVRLDPTFDEARMNLSERRLNRHAHTGRADGPCADLLAK